MTAERNGWGWFEGPTTAVPAPTDAGDDIARVFARCFRGADGERAMAYLRSLTVERAVGPAIADAALRHLEGQRALVLHLAGLAERGRTGALVPNPTEES